MRFFGNGCAKTKFLETAAEGARAGVPILMTCEERDEFVRALAGTGMPELRRRHAIVKARKKTMMDRYRKTGHCDGTEAANLDELEKMIAKAIWLADKGAQ